MEQVWDTWCIILQIIFFIEPEDVSDIVLDGL